MGTYKGEPVRWRYVSADGKTPYDASKGRPQSVRGYYVLETEVNLGYSNNIEYVTDVSGINQYHTNAQYSNIYVGDYATSNLRDYFIKTSGGLMSMLNISQDNEIYKAITPQSMAKLYENIYVNEDWDSGDVVYTYSEIPENARKYYASESTHADFNQATDKFFAPSMKEYLELGISTAWCYYPDEMSGETLSFGYWLRAMCGYVGMRIEGGYGLMSSDLFAGGQSGFQARAAFIIS